MPCFVKLQTGITFLVPAYPGCPGEEAVKRVSVCPVLIPGCCWQGLDRCSQLEELSLDNNCIRHIEGASHWPLLQRLSLADNLISSIDDSGLDSLTRLQYLSLENNCITSMTGFQQISALSELYLSGNLVNNARSIFSLKVERSV